MPSVSKRWLGLEPRPRKMPGEHPNHSANMSMLEIPTNFNVLYFN